MGADVYLPNPPIRVNWGIKHHYLLVKLPTEGVICLRETTGLGVDSPRTHGMGANLVQ